MAAPQRLSFEKQADVSRPSPCCCARPRRALEGSGDDAHETLVQFALVVEDRLTDLIHRPHALRVIGVIDEPTRKHLVAISRRVEEVDGLPSRDAVPGRPDVERNVIARNDIGSLAYLVPRI